MAASWMTSGLASRGRRLISAAVAIIIGVAFLTTSLAVLASAKAGMEESFAGGLRSADLVVTRDGEQLRGEDHDALAGVAGVTSVVGETMVVAERGPNEHIMGANIPRDGLTIVEGRLPSAPGEVLATKALADAGVGAGEQLRLTPMPTSENESPKVVTLDVVGVADPGTSNPILYGQAFLAQDATLRMVEPSLGYQSLQAQLSDGTSYEGARPGVDAVISGAKIQTGQQAAEDRVATMTGDTAVMSAMFLGFGAVALVTAAIVIANTFTITLAQRTGELALLRCVGATKAQVRRSVLLEAVVLGVVASAVGVALGVLAALGLLAVLRNLDVMPLSGGLELDAVTLLAPLVVGTLVTVLASLLPARRATRVSPLAALRPTGEMGERTSVGWVRIGLALLLLVGGTALMVLAATTRNVPIGVLGGLVSFAGVLVAAIIVVPMAVRALGLGARAAGVPGRLAVDNAVRNPGRVAATSAALIVGVTLITMTSVGAASGERTALGEIDKEYAVDLVAAPLPQDGQGEGTPGEGGDSDMVPPVVGSSVSGQLGAVEGVAASVPVDTAYVTLGESMGQSMAIGLDHEDAVSALRSKELVDGLQPGTLGLGDSDLAIHGLKPGDTITVTGAAGDKELTVLELGLGDNRLAMHHDDLAALAGADRGQGAVLLRLDDKADLGATYSELQKISGEENLSLDGSAGMRAMITQVLNVMVLVTTALLGVAVLIAVVGIANTLSLSIIERHREHALLRGLGLTRGQVRTMLLTEGVLIALVSAGIGLLLGVGYAALGIQTILPAGTSLELAVPWARVGLIVGVALLAGVLASVLPARRATRVSPAEGLAAA